MCTDAYKLCVQKSTTIFEYVPTLYNLMNIVFHKCDAKKQGNFQYATCVKWELGENNM